jgi:hypothetical protein
MSRHALPQSHFDRNEPKGYLVRPLKVLTKAARWKSSQGLAGEQHADRLPGQHSTPPPDWLRTPALPIAPKPDRATYEAFLRAELGRIRRLDVAHRDLLSSLRPFGIRRGETAGMMRIFPWMRRRNTIRRSPSCISAAESWSTVEGYLLGCVASPSLTGGGALRRTTSTDRLSDLLQAEDDLMIRTF